MNNDQDVLQFSKDVVGYYVIDVYVEHNVGIPQIIDDSELVVELAFELDAKDEVQCTGFKTTDVTEDVTIAEEVSTEDENIDPNGVVEDDITTDPNGVIEEGKVILMVLLKMVSLLIPLVLLKKKILILMVLLKMISLLILMVLMKKGIVILMVLLKMVSLLIPPVVLLKKKILILMLLLKKDPLILMRIILQARVALRIVNINLMKNLRRVRWTRLRCFPKRL